jgi:hypothetical protein
LRRIISVAGLDEMLVDLSPAELQSVSGTLSCFVVGTEQRKLAPPPADPLSLGPFRQLKGSIKSLVGGAGDISERMNKKMKLSRQSAARKAAGYAAPDCATSDASSDPGANSGSGNDEAVDYNSILGMVRFASHRAISKEGSIQPKTLMILRIHGLHGPFRPTLCIREYYRTILAVLK